MDKKTIIKRIASVVAFVVILTLVLNRVYEIVSWKDTYGNYMSSVKELYSTPDDTIDLVFVGSSHMYGGIDPNYFWTEYGIPAFDMCCSGQDKNSAVHQLKELLKTQSPRLVVVEAYAFLYDKQEDVGNVYRNMLSLDFSRNANELIKDYVEEDEREDFYLRWPIVHTRYAELGKYDFEQYEPSIYGRGFNYNFKINPIGLDWESINTTDLVEIGDTNKAWIDELKQMSLEENFDLIFVEVTSDVSHDEQAILNGCEQYLSENGIPYIDLNKMAYQIGISEANDFVDFNHLNYTGAQKATAYLSTYLLENYDFEPHDFEEEYELWDMNAEYALHRVWLDELDRLEGLDYLKASLSQEDVVTVFSLDGWYSESETDWNGLLSQFGLAKEDEPLDSCGLWMFRNGKVLAKISNSIDEHIRALNINDRDTIVIKNKQEDGAVRTHIYINDCPCSITNDGLNVWIYDEMLGEVVSTKHFD